MIFEIPIYYRISRPRTNPVYVYYVCVCMNMYASKHVCMNVCMYACTHYARMHLDVGR